MGKLKFTRNEECNTTTINIENAFIEISKDDYNIFNMGKTKLGYYTARLQIFNVELKNKLKSWEKLNSDIIQHVYKYLMLN